MNACMNERMASLVPSRSGLSVQRGGNRASVPKKVGGLSTVKLPVDFMSVSVH